MEIIEFLNREKSILFTILLFTNVVDYLTGCWKARILKKENSKEGMRGIFNKICCWIMLLIGFILSFRPVFCKGGVNFACAAITFLLSFL